MTIEELRSCEDVFIYPHDIAPILGCDPHSIRVIAKTNPRLLGFPVTIVGRRVKIWRIPFLKYIGELGSTGGETSGKGK